MEEYYTPPVAERKPPVEGLETVPVRLKEDAIIKYLSRKIYTSWKSALRELYANELTAAKKAARMGAHPTIEITLDPKTRELTIHGKDSLGITGEKFKVLRYYGRSGNFSGSDAGQFGFGFKSYVSCADEVRVETFARETNERYGFVGVQGAEFRQVPDGELTISEYGTKVSLVIRSAQESADGGGNGGGENRRIELPDVVETFEDVCRFAEIDTYLSLPSPIIAKEKSSWRDGEYEYTWREAGRWKLNCTPREYARRECGGKGYDFEYDTDDFYFYGYLAIEKEGNEVRPYGHNHSEVRLVGMPIEVKIRNPDPEERRNGNPFSRPSYPFSFWYINLKDERKFMPTADRERLKEGLFVRVNEKVVEFLKREFAKMAIQSFDDYRDSPYKPIYNALGPEGREEFAKYFDDRTRRVCYALGIPVCGIDDDGEEEEGGGRRGSRWRRELYGLPTGVHQTTVRRIVAKSRHVFILNRKRAGASRGSLHKEKLYGFPIKTAATIRKILRAKYPDAEVFLFPGPIRYWNDEDFERAKDDFRILTRDFGVPDARAEAAAVKKELGRDWRRAAGIIEEKAAPEMAVVWVCRRGYRVEPVKKRIDKLLKNTVRVRKNIREWVDLLREYHSRRYSFTKDAPGMSGGMTEEEFAAAVASTRVVTTEGGTTTTTTTTTTISKASESHEGLIVFRFDDPEILKFYRPKNRKVILAPTDESAFGAIAHLMLTKKAYTVTDRVEPKLVASPTEPGRTYDDPAQVNYLYIARQRLGGASADRRLMALLRDALSNSAPGEMKPLVDTAVEYSRFAEQIPTTSKEEREGGGACQ